MNALIIIGRLLTIVGCLILLATLIFREKIILLVKSTRYSPNEYQRVKRGSTKLSNELRILVARNQELLLLNQIPLAKIRFVFQPNFTYDVDKNVINPPYEMFLPLRKDGSGLFDKDAPVIELGKPKNLMMVGVNNYKVDDNYAFIKHILQGTKRGIAIFLVDEMVDDLFGHGEEKIHYYSSVDAENLRLINLDEAVANIQEVHETQDLLVK